MTQEEKQLLLQDLCARLPYGVMCDRLGHPLKLVGVHPNKEFALEFDRGEYMPTEYTVEDVKPYLRPMSSMTDEEHNLLINLFDTIYNPKAEFYFIADFYNQRMLDYRNLIPKGLALEAPEGIYK